MVKISLFSSSPVTILIPLCYYWFFLGYFEVILIFRELPWFAFQLITLAFLLFSLLILICYSRNQKKCRRYIMAQGLLMIITDGQITLRDHFLNVYVIYHSVLITFQVAFSPELAVILVCLLFQERNSRF